MNLLAYLHTISTATMSSACTVSQILQLISPNLNMSHDRISNLFGGNLSCIRSYSTCLPNLKCLASTARKMWYGPTILNSGHLTLTMPLDSDLSSTRWHISLEIIAGADFGVERLQCAKLLGVNFDNKLSFVRHVDFLIRTSSQQFYLLQQTRKQGLTDDCLQVIFNSIIYNRILYALSAWGGYLSRDNINCLDAAFKKAVWWKLTQDCHSFDQLLMQCNSRLFSQSSHVDRCLHHFWAPRQNSRWSRRSTVQFSELQKVSDHDLGSGQGHINMCNTYRTISCPTTWP